MDIKCQACSEGSEPYLRYGFYTHINEEKLQLCTRQLPHYVVTAVKAAVEEEITAAQAQSPDHPLQKTD